MKTLPASLHTEAYIVNDSIVITQLGDMQSHVDISNRKDVVVIPIKYWALFVSDISSEIMNHTMTASKEQRYAESATRTDRKEQEAATWIHKNLCNSDMNMDMGKDGRKEKNESL